MVIPNEDLLGFLLTRHLYFIKADLIGFLRYHRILVSEIDILHNLLHQLGNMLILAVCSHRLLDIFGQKDALVGQLRVCAAVHLLRPIQRLNEVGYQLFISLLPLPKLCVYLQYLLVVLTLYRL